MNIWARESLFLKGCDGCRLAVDIYKPLSGHGLKQLPVILHTGYNPRRSAYKKFSVFIDKLISEGYIVVIAEPRGVGASFGRHDGFWSRKDARDMKCIIDQIGKMPWCNGRVGMFGSSNCGMIQLLTAAEKPEHLKAIIPCDNNSDFYYQNFPNGASALPYLPETHKDASSEVVPVDEDSAPDFPLAKSVQNAHLNNGRFLSQYEPNMFRDSFNQVLGYAPNQEVPAWERVENIKYSDIRVYSNASWFDSSCTGGVIGYKAYGDKLLIGPWTHSQMHTGVSALDNGTHDWMSDHLRFFDACLKGEENSVFNEPPVRYYMCNGKSGNEWRWSADFPLDNQVLTDLYLSSPSESDVSSDGTAYLTSQMPRSGKLEYKVEKSVNFFNETGKMNRRIESDLSSLDSRTLVFTSEPLSRDIELMGLPSVSLWVTSTYEDGNFIAVLEEVNENGESRYLTDGAGRASHSKITPHSVWNSLGLAYHSSLEKDAVKLSSETPLNLVFNLDALSSCVNAGYRLRLRIMCAEEAMYQQPNGFPAPPPTITLYTGSETASFLRLPVIKPDLNEFSDGEISVYTFKRGVYFNKAGNWTYHKNVQVYSKDDEIRYVTEAFTAIKKTNGNTVQLGIETPEFIFKASGNLPETGYLSENSMELKLLKPDSSFGKNKSSIEPDFKNIYLATVPVKAGQKGMPNIQPFSTLDLFIDVALPDTGMEKYPCIVNIHGYSGSHHDFGYLAEPLLKSGYAIASIDYRVYPPNIWPAPMHDVKAAIRFLKANSKKYKLDPERFGVMGGSAGGHLSAIVAATNGKPEFEGDIAGNNDFTSTVKAAAIYFPWTDIFSFGDDQSIKYSGNSEKVMMADGPYSPLGAMVGYSGPGKGMGKLKKHLHDESPFYKTLIAKSIEASPVSHVDENSAPSVFVHGIFEGGVEIPMQQSIRMFERLTEKGVKSLLLCNNNCFYGEDPEVRMAVLEFIKLRV